MTTPSLEPMTVARFARWRRSIDTFTILVAAIALCAPKVDTWLRGDDVRGPHREQRAAIAKPPPPRTLEDFRKWPGAWQAWWNDRFGLRDALLIGNGMLKVFGFGVGPGPNHVIGKEGWIFWRGAGVLEAWRGANPLAGDSLAAWVRRLEDRRARCAALGARYLFVLVPEKISVYPEFLPERYAKIGPSRSDALFLALQGSGIDALDLRKTVAHAKLLDSPGNTAYFEHGTHWRTWCAALAANAILEHLKPVFPSLEPIPLSAFAPQHLDGLGDSEARAMYLDGFFEQEEHAVAPATQRSTTERLGGFPRVRTTRLPEAADRPRAVVFHDSFGIYFEKPLAESFAALTMIWSYAFDPALIEREKPDVVIEIFAERVLQTLTPFEEAPLRDLAREFAEAEPRFELDPRAASAWTPMYRASIVAAGDATDPRLDFTGFGTPDCVVLPKFDLSGERLLVRFDVTAPAPTSLEIYFKREGDTAYAPNNKATIALTAGRNEGVLAIEEKSLVDHLVLSPGGVRGRYELRAFEVRAARSSR